jgi:hypothetical protein
MGAIAVYIAFLLPLSFLIALFSSVKGLTNAYAALAEVEDPHPFGPVSKQGWGHCA